MADEIKAPEAAGETAQPQAQQDQTELTINDLNLLKSIIDLASSRGAFKAGQEMVAVGQTYAKLAAFLEAVQKQADAQKAQQGA